MKILLNNKLYEVGEPANEVSEEFLSYRKSVGGVFLVSLIIIDYCEADYMCEARNPPKISVGKNFRERSEPYNLQRLCEATNYKDFRLNVNNGSSKTSCLTFV